MLFALDRILPGRAPPKENASTSLKTRRVMPMYFLRTECVLEYCITVPTMVAPIGPGVAANTRSLAILSAVLVMIHATQIPSAVVNQTARSKTAEFALGAMVTVATTETRANVSDPSC